MAIQAAAIDSYATFESLCRRIRPRVYRLAYHQLGNAQDAEDITQEVFLRAWTHYASYDATRSFDSWVVRITINLCIDHLRRKKVRPAVSLDAYIDAEADRQIQIKELVDLSNDPATRLQEQEVDGRLRTCIERLSVTHRECVQLLVGGHTYEEIAVAMNCPLGTVRSRLYRARGALRRHLELGPGEHTHQLT